MYKGLLGQESELAVVFIPDEGTERPNNLTVFKAFKQAIEERVPCRTGKRWFNSEIFTINGGSVAYEFTPWGMHDGLIEIRTPECHSPLELLTYQRAQELLMRNASPRAQDLLAEMGYFGTLGLLKNCRDHQGKIYGIQENYQVDVASGLMLVFYRIFAALGIFVAAAATILYFAWIPLLIVLTLFGFAALYLLRTMLQVLPIKKLRKFQAKIQSLLKPEDLEARLLTWEYAITAPIQHLACLPFTINSSVLAFSQHRRRLAAFFASRIIFTGAGCLLDDGQFCLSEKATALKTIGRYHSGATTRSIFDSGNLLKDYLYAGVDLLWGRFGNLKRLFSRSQRLQIGLSDGNRCQLAEYLRLGTTTVLMQMVDAGWLQDAPRLKGLVKSVHRLNRDPSLRASLQTKNGEQLNAFDLQRYYLSEAERYTKSLTQVPLELADILKMWRQVLDQLEENPGNLIGRLDWVTKRYLLDGIDEPLTFSEQKKVDLAYHDLLGGFFQDFETEKLAVELVSPEAVIKAEKEPSSPLRVQARSKMIRDLAYSGERVKISWDSVYIRKQWTTKVIRLDDYRAKI